jgi:hypothetical protein
MAPSVRVRRRHAYASIRDEDRNASERLIDSPEQGRRALSEGAGALSPSAASEPVPLPTDSVHSTPHDTNLLAPGYIPSRGDTSRVNRHVRTSSFSYRSFNTDPDPNVSRSPPATFSRLSNNLSPPHEVSYEGPHAEVVVPGHRGHTYRASRVQSALSSSPSRGHDSDSDSDYDSEDEERIMEDDEHHHDDDVVDHLDVIGQYIYMSPLELRNASLLQTHKSLPLQHSQMRQTLSSCAPSTSISTCP